MAITPNNYPFNGGAFISGSDTPVDREDIHTLTLTKGGSSLGQYNPLIGNTSINIPSNASDDTSTFTKSGGDTSSMASGSKLSAIFTAISSFFATVASHLSNTSNPHNVTPAQIGAEHSANKVTSWSSTVNDTHYPSEKLVKDSLDAISGNTTPLIAGTNISITTSASGVRIDASDPAAITDAEINALFP